MGRKKRNTPEFGLSFLDVMSCGFGATVLLLLIVDHRIDIGATQHTASIEALHAEQEHTIQTLREALLVQQNENQTQIDAAQALSKEAENTKAAITTSQKSISALKGVIEKLKSVLKQKQRTDDDLIAPSQYITSKGRQSLSGLRLDGKRVLILLDSSASMLDQTLVNVIIRRNLSPTQKKASPKWQRSLLILDWVGNQFKALQNFQIHTFNTMPTPLLQGTETGGWERFGKGHSYRQAVKDARNIVPGDGTNLYNAFDLVRHLKPKPDNVILITDSLPTQGLGTSRRNLVTGAERLRHFKAAFDRLPGRVPVNIILLPFEGDPDAAGAFWRLAEKTKGAFIVPSQDWP